MTLWLSLAALFFIAAALGALVLSDWTANRAAWSLLSAAGSLSLVVAGWQALLGQRFELLVPSAYPGLALRLASDPLSGWFLFATGVVAFAICLFSLGYSDRFAHQPHRRSFGVSWGLLLLSLMGILLAGDALTLFLSWECMTLFAYLLVNFEYEREGVARAGLIMLVLNHIGALFFMGGFLFLFGRSGDFSFSALHASATAFGPAAKGLLFLLFLFGFGVKAGLLPLHIWLPLAHPAAPGNMSALLSAVVVNMGIYGIARSVLTVLAPGPWWWGLLALTLGTATALYGILYALMETDLKRVLAFSTIENLGLIIAGLGLSLLFQTGGNADLAALALVAALLHVLTHGLYKGLLFLGAGAIDHATGVRDLDRLGGLLRLMPLTGATFFIGALAISALPPMSGFVSEWMILQTLLQSFHLQLTLVRVATALAGAALALTMGLAVTCFVRAFGIGFLGMPRSEQAEAAHEVTPSMRWGMGLLAAGTVFLGVLPTVVIPALANLTQQLVGADVTSRIVPPVYVHTQGLELLVALGGRLFSFLPVMGLVVTPANPGFSSISGGMLLVAIAGFGLLAWGLVRVRRVVASRRIVPVWAGGISNFRGEMQFTATSFVTPVRMLFQGLFQPRSELTRQGESAHFPEGFTYRLEVLPVVEHYLYRPLQQSVLRAATVARQVQSGSVSLYMAYVLGALVLALIWR